MVFVCLAAATVNGLPQDRVWAARVQAALRMVLALGLPAALIAGAAQPRRQLQAFCIGALFPALAGAAIVWLWCDDGIKDLMRPEGDRPLAAAIEYIWLSVPNSRYEVATMWIVALACGAAGGFFDWLQGGAAKEDARDMARTLHEGL